MHTQTVPVRPQNTQRCESRLQAPPSCLNTAHLSTLTKSVKSYGYCAPSLPPRVALKTRHFQNGPPILTESDKPTSFVFRVPLPRRASPAEASRDASEEAVVKPRGLPERKYHEQPPRTYRARRKHNPEQSCVDLDDIIMHHDKRWYKQHGQWFPLDDGQPEDTLRDTSTHRKELAEAIPGLTKRTRGRYVPKAGATDDPRRKHICPVETCRKAFTKRDHVNRHIMTIHGHGSGIYDARECHRCVSRSSLTSGCSQAVR